MVLTSSYTIWILLASGGERSPSRAFTSSLTAQSKQEEPSRTLPFLLASTLCECECVCVCVCVCVVMIIHNCDVYSTVNLFSKHLTFCKVYCLLLKLKWNIKIIIHIIIDNPSIQQ